VLVGGECLYVEGEGFEMVTTRGQCSSISDNYDGDILCSE